MYDLSLVTDTLCEVLSHALMASPIWGGAGPSFHVAVTGRSPEESELKSDCDLNFFLFHVSEDPYLKNVFWTPAGQAGAGNPPGQPVAGQPMGLDLHYLLSARSKDNYVQEQQVMGVAMKALHEQAIVTVPTPIPFGLDPTKVTVTMEHPTWDELCRLWQGLATPMRMTAQYRVSVVFLTPETPPGPAVQVKQYRTAAGPVSAITPGAPELITTTRVVSYTTPSGPSDPDANVLSPASMAPAPSGSGQDIDLRGLGILDTDTIWLVSVAPSGVQTEYDISGWKVPLAPPYPSPPSNGVDVVLRAPATTGTAPADCPPAGSYLLCAKRGSTVSNAVPVAITAWVDPAGGPLINPDNVGLFTCSVSNLSGTEVEVRLGTVQLSAASGPLTAGSWSLAGTTLTFLAPADLATGTYPLGVRAGGVEADPARWVVVP